MAITGHNEPKKTFPSCVDAIKSYAGSYCEVELAGQQDKALKRIDDLEAKPAASPSFKKLGPFFGTDTAEKHAHGLPAEPQLVICEIVKHAGSDGMFKFPSTATSGAKDGTTVTVTATKDCQYNVYLIG